MELKDDQVRIVMKHTTNNIYCVMGVFAKKANNDRKMYRTMCNRTVTDIITTNDIDERYLIQLAVSAEKNSEHPLGEAIVKYGEENNIEFNG